MEIHDIFDHEQKFGSRVARSARKHALAAAQGGPGEYSSWAKIVKDAGEAFTMGVDEAELRVLVRYHLRINPDAWKVLLPIVSCDCRLYAAMAARALIVTHPDGIEAGARSVVQAIRRRFDFMNLADASDYEVKIRAALLVMHGMLDLGATELLPSLVDLAGLLPEPLPQAVLLDMLSIQGDVADEDADDVAVDAPVNALTVEYCLYLLGRVPDMNLETIGFAGAALVGLPDKDKEKPVLEAYHYPKGAITPHLSFVSFSEWASINADRIRQLGMREAGDVEDSWAEYIFGGWRQSRPRRPSKTQLYRQTMFANSHVALLRPEAFPLKW